VPVSSAKGGLRNVGRLDANLVVATTQIDLTEVLRALEPVEQLVDPRQRVAVLDRDVVQRTIVDTHTHGAILLLDEKDRGTERRLTRLDESGLGQLFELLLQLVQLRGTEAEGRTTLRDGTGYQLDTMIHFTRGW